MFHIDKCNGHCTRDECVDLKGCTLPVEDNMDGDNDQGDVRVVQDGVSV